MNGAYPCIARIFRTRKHCRSIPEPEHLAPVVATFRPHCSNNQSITRIGTGLLALLAQNNHGNLECVEEGVIESLIFWRTPLKQHHLTCKSHQLTHKSPKNQYEESSPESIQNQEKVDGNEASQSPTHPATASLGRIVADNLSSRHLGIRDSKPAPPRHAHTARDLL
ncbi:hypothetical protein BLNAU_1375 [Blattamonas nauphoetae]|uniref:Uncharacterized protein n=1 Tax=Blattamonas nauphoetae TaxID=2049346 RepID=A0ABQ9YJ62_9EUKA|nr:hypothetical protein BLNAU_1375 [Blattamonas nauphoetae]